MSMRFPHKLVDKTMEKIGVNMKFVVFVKILVAFMDLEKIRVHDKGKSTRKTDCINWVYSMEDK
jgi:hypothetical protein